MESPAGTLPKRPVRADARRNYDRLVVAAREVFTERGTESSLEEIARRAGVGIGTLYRHFPTRLALIEAVYLRDVEGLERSAVDLATGEPWAGLVTWLRQLVDYIATKKVLFAELHDAVDKDSALMSCCRDSLHRAAATVLDRAQKAGVVRADLDYADLLRLVSGITMSQPADSQQNQRLLGLLLDGLRAEAAQPTSRAGAEASG